MYRYTVPVVNREPVDYPAFWHNGLEGSEGAVDGSNRDQAQIT